MKNKRTGNQARQRARAGRVKKWAKKVVTTPMTGHEIARLRARAGFTQATLAAELGVSSGTVGAWEMGWSIPKQQLWPKLAETIGATVDTLTRERLEKAMAS